MIFTYMLSSYILFVLLLCHCNWVQDWTDISVTCLIHILVWILFCVNILNIHTKFTCTINRLRKYFAWIMRNKLKVYIASVCVCVCGGQGLDDCYELDMFIYVPLLDLLQSKWWAGFRDLLPFYPMWLITAGLVALYLCLTFLLPVPGCPT